MQKRWCATKLVALENPLKRIAIIQAYVNCVGEHVCSIRFGEASLLGNTKRYLTERLIARDDMTDSHLLLASIQKVLDSAEINFE